MRELQLKFRDVRKERNRLGEQIRKLSEAINRADKLLPLLTNQSAQDLPLLRDWWQDVIDFEKFMGDQIHGFETDMSLMDRSPGLPPINTRGILNAVKGQMERVCSNFMSAHAEAVRVVEDVKREIHELRLKEDGLGLTRDSLELTRMSLKNSKRAFWLSIAALALTILFGIATKVFEPTLFWIQHHVPQIIERPVPPPVRVPPLSLLK
jgi:hypothetical protein